MFKRHQYWSYQVYQRVARHRYRVYSELTDQTKSLKHFLISFSSCFHAYSDSNEFKLLVSKWPTAEMDEHRPMTPPNRQTPGKHNQMQPTVMPFNYRFAKFEFNIHCWIYDEKHQSSHVHCPTFHSTLLSTRPTFAVVLDTNRWYHKTLIVGDEISITIGSEFD